MSTLVKRSIVQIDEDKCDGCGLCVPSCAEGAIQIIDGKARLVDDKFCDGLGACLGECPQDAIKIIDREAEIFDEEAAEEHIRTLDKSDEKPLLQHHDHKDSHFEGCPSARVISYDDESTFNETEARELTSTLRQWPIQIKLVPPHAPFLQNSDLLVAADCVPFADANFHNNLLKGKSVLIGCPKLDDAEFYIEKFTDIFNAANIKSVTIAIMEVPCCSGLSYIIKQALTKSGKDIPLEEVVIGLKGDKIS